MIQKKLKKQLIIIKKNMGKLKIMTSKEDFKIINGNICAKTAIVCDILNIDVSTLYKWNKKGCPKAQTGDWSLADLFKWLGFIGTENNNNCQNANIENMSIKEQKLYFETKYKQAQCESSEWKNAINKGDYIAKEEIISTMDRYLPLLNKSLKDISLIITKELLYYLEKINAQNIGKIAYDTMFEMINQLTILDIYKANLKKLKT